MNIYEKVRNGSKWGVYETAGVVALCQLILLFSEFKLFPGIGVLVNGLYHIAAIACAVFIFLMIFKDADDQEVYGSYLIAIQSLLSSFVDICALIIYLKTGKKTNAVLIVFFVLLIITEMITSYIFVQYGRDRVTCILAFLAVLIAKLLRAVVFSETSSKLSASAGEKTTVSMFSVWTLLSGIFFLLMVVCFLIYEDAYFLGELKDNPKEFFSKKAFFGTYYNTYVKEKKQSEDAPQQPNNSSIEQPKQIMTELVQQNSIIKTVVCFNCGYPLTEEQTVCPECGITVKNIDDEKEIKRIQYDKRLTCSECGCPLTEEQTVCPECGITVKKIGEEKEIKRIQYDKRLICSECGCPLTEGQSICPDCGNVLGQNDEKEPNLKTAGNRTIICPECGCSLPEEQLTCSECGFPLKKTGNGSQAWNQAYQPNPNLKGNAKKRFIIVLDICLAVVCCLSGLYVRFNSKNKENKDWMEYYNECAEDFDDKYHEMRDNASEYKSGSLFHTSYTNLAYDYEDLRDEAKQNASDYKKKINTAIIVSTLLFVGCIILVLCGVLVAKKERRDRYGINRVPGM